MRALMISCLLACLLAALLLAPAAALAGEGDPLLSVDDLHALQDSYEAFLDELEAMIVSRGLLSEDDREAWRDAQMGDFFQNGGYGSILASYMPGMLSYVREEDTLLTLHAECDFGTLELNTVRRYTPQDSSLSGLMLSLTLTDGDGLPQDVIWQLDAPSGLFLKWDALAGAYVSVGTSAQSRGETICWSAQTPVQSANDPVLTITLLDGASYTPLGHADLTLTVDGTGYLVRDDALRGR